MPGYEAEIPDFERYDAQVVGISVDSVPSHVAFAKTIGGIERYPLLARFRPHALQAPPEVLAPVLREFLLSRR